MLANTVKMNQRPGMVRDEGVTVCVTGAMLAPAPAAEAPPVFVDDSGTRRKLIRFTGGLISLILIGFLGLVGVALAVPSVGATVGLGNVTPFTVPGAAAKPPPPAPVAVVKKRVQTIAPVRHTAPKPPVTSAPKKEAPVVIAPPATEPPASEAPTTEAPTSEAPTTEAPTSEAPTTEAPTSEAPTTEAPVVDPPASEAPVADPPVVIVVPQPVLDAAAEAVRVLDTRDG